VTVGDGISGLGKTRYKWAPEVERVVHRALIRIPSITANTYVCHPWCGWGRWSVDFWGALGRGHAIRQADAEDTLQYLFNLPGHPFIRHYIFEHSLWTSFGGESYWTPNDHSGELKHLHITYWPT
jgi:hypothetical protein